MLKRILLAVTFIGATIGAQQSYASRLGYDPKADPFQQYAQAVEQAKAEGKLVLVIAGGDWCTWCHKLNKFVHNNDDVRSRLEDTFVVMKVYIGDENYNEDFFSQLSPARGAPHFWVVSPERHLLGAQSTGAFERGKKGYDKHEFLSFIERWKQRAVASGP